MPVLVEEWRRLLEYRGGKALLADSKNALKKISCVELLRNFVSQFITIKPPLVIDNGINN